MTGTHKSIHTKLENTLTCCPILLHPHLCSPFLYTSLHCAPLLLLDLLFSLVRACLMPLSMLIVHCSKAAFIKMIKHSQTTAKYLKASGYGTWQVTTSHTNSSTSILPIPPPPLANVGHIPCLVGHRLSPYVTWAPNEKLSADEGGWLHKTTDLPPPTHTHTHTFPSTHQPLTAHRCPLQQLCGFSGILLNQAGPESQKCKTCHFSFSFHLCPLLTSLSSIQWMFSTLSHKGVCL